ncbi:MAG TPA: hypothetical protein VE953_23625, partial [Terriglobales bacterium]|nr:hypothetical protein [Terriglobales bacterium]
MSGAEAEAGGRAAPRDLAPGRAAGVVGRVRSAGRSTTAWAAAGLGAAAIVRAYVFHASPAVVYSDTTAYLFIGASPLTSSQWWAGGKPPVMPLAYRLVGDTVAAGLVLQLVIAMVAWSVLAVVVARAIRTRWL